MPSKVLFSIVIQFSGSSQPKFVSWNTNSYTLNSAVGEFSSSVSALRYPMWGLLCQVWPFKLNLNETQLKFSLLATLATQKEVNNSRWPWPTALNKDTDFYCHTKLNWIACCSRKTRKSFLSDQCS